ncbi:ABC transporter permease [Pseudarthrobacter raffinosi]|uniref:ABC transporter permease n=1 Tax=Pseudarthrobacter raffinosi TaxID=2953651 RepID=UPI00208FF178|nr:MULTISPECIES: ABC transporter permease subunit [unclassified Pseudarthrobacter]MCO4239045.1 ABC transporter permease subunit [Pseudarthrobacter sp. MDT3-28]MCO4251990.1 ABC transporter permease subunit [Pseudarthrobacter sp. MDT3-9]MCO4262864.1 ABC transporter permease subunit [Pseudarthrobacter sp. MDT3-26]
MSQLTEQTQRPPASGFGAGYLAGIRDVVVLELKQRLRSRGWYIMLAIWFILTGLVTWLTWASWNAQREAQRAYSNFLPPDTGPGSMIFEVVLAFVLLFALLVAPALSANAVNGDRAGGTLAILQVTLLRPGQILWGKFFAAWAAALAFLVASTPFLVIGVALGGMTPGHVIVALLMLAVEVGVVCAIGVGISALAGRPLFSIVVTYLAVAGLVFGSLIAFGLGTGLSQGTVMANQAQYRNYEPLRPVPDETAPQEPEYTCSGPLRAQPAVRTERVAWMLAMNPYVVVADAIPYTVRVNSGLGMSSPVGAIESISQGARYAMAGPEGTYPCANGEAKPQYLAQSTPLWPLGLGLQLLLAGLLMWLGWRSLRTPAHRLARGTRIA